MLLVMPSRAGPECDDLSQARDCDGATLMSQARIASGAARRVDPKRDDTSQ